MKNKKRIFGAAALLFITAAVIASAAAIPAFSQNYTQIDDILSKSVSDKYETIDKILSEKSGDVEAYIQKCAKISDNAAEKYDDIYDYAYFVIKYDIKGSDLKYINSLLDDGAPLPCVSGVYKFWLTTGEDISIIGDIIGLKDDFWGNGWIENAFNSLTDNKCGVIESMEELNSYIESGLTYQDIYNANILCRRGKKTIQEILEMKSSGKSWSYINKRINGSILDAINIFDSDNGYFEPENNGIFNLTGDIKSVAVSESDVTETAKKLKEARVELEEEISGKIHSYLLSQGINSLESKEASDNEYDGYDELLEYADNSNVFNGYVYQLENKGYKYDEIKAVIDIMSSRDTDIAEAVSIYKKQKAGAEV